jgi:hypothetical protein
MMPMKKNQILLIFSPVQKGIQVPRTELAQEISKHIINAAYEHSGLADVDELTLNSNSEVCLNQTSMFLIVSHDEKCCTPNALLKQSLL